MPETNPLGQVAYAAYVAALRPSVVRYLPGLYANLGPAEHRAWDAAAQAVLADTPRFQFALGSHVRRTIDPEHLWEIWWRSCREEVGRTTIDYGLRLVGVETDAAPCRMSDGSDLLPAEEAPHG